MTEITRVLNRLYHYLKPRFFTFDRVCVYRLSETIPQTSDATVVNVSPDNVHDARSFQSEHLISVFEQFLEAGDSGYYAYLGGNCVHRSWVQSNQQLVQPHWAYEYKLSANESFIHYCETADTARGHGIYPHVLSCIASDLQSRRLLIAISQKNIPSLRGAEKVGFKPEFMVTALVILGINFSKVHSLVR